MASAVEMKQRLRRLLAGERNSRDLDVLFLGLRHRSFGHRIVADVGDFAAHAEERDKGLAWTGVQNLARTFTFHMPRIAAHGRGDVPPATQSEIAEAVLAAFHLDSPASVKKATGLGQRKAERVLKAALPKVRHFDGQKIALNQPFVGDERRIFSHYMSTMIVAPAFTDESLIREFAQCAVKNRLVGNDEAKAILPLKEFVALYAIEKMHLSKIRLDADRIVSLALFQNGKPERTLEIVASVKVPGPLVQPTIIAAIFQTSCKSEDWCSPKLQELLARRQILDSPLEIGPSGKLQVLN